MGLTAYVAIYDIAAIATGNETLSTAFGRAIHHPSHRWKTTVLWLYVSCHLFDMIPYKIDPLDRLGDLGRILHQHQDVLAED